MKRPAPRAVPDVATVRPRRAARPGLVALISSLLLVGIAAPASATVAPSKRQAEINSQIEALHDQFQEASDEEDDLAGRVAESRQRTAAIDARIASLDVQLAGVQRRVDAAQARFDEMAAQALVAEQRLEEAQNELAEAKADLQRRAVAAYVNQSDLQVASASLAVTDARAYAAGQGYLQTVVSKQHDAVERFHQLKVEAAALQHSLELQRDQARLQRDVVGQEAQQLESVKNENQSARNEAAAHQAHESELLGEVRASKAKVAAEIAQLKAESNSISAFLRGSQSGGGGVVIGRGILGYPIPGAPITSTFGPRVHPIFGDVRMHSGIDFGATMGTPIRAAADGVVLFAGVRGGYGNTTLIDHGGSLASMYCHQSQFAVVPGQHVTRGQVIGYVGSTGFSTGPHLHFETRVNGTPVDPMQFF